jgi:arylamine N-acetyltransferase
MSDREEDLMNDQQIASYLDRLHMTIGPGPDLASLRKLQGQHLMCILYENLDSLDGRITSLSHERLFSKIIDGHRGGICFELNSLYNWLLESLGFQMTSYAARFIDEDDEIQMRRHRVLCAHIDDRRYLTDVGVNSESPRMPLLMEAGAVQSDGLDDYRLTKDDFWGWLLWQKEPGKDWRRLYGFTEEPQMDFDFVMPCVFCDLHPLSPINKTLKASIFTEDTNITIRDGRLEHYRHGEVQERIPIPDVDRLQHILRDVFGIEYEGCLRV